MLRTKSSHWLSLSDNQFLFFILTPIAFLINWNTFDADFVFDDTRAILENDDVLGKTEMWELFKNDFWGLELAHSGSHKSYRPFCVLSFRLTHQLFSADAAKIDPGPFHVGNVLLYIAVTVVLYKILRFVFNEKHLSHMCSLLFLAHPVHCESVASVVGRAELGSCFFSLLALFSHLLHLHSTFPLSTSSSRSAVKNGEISTLTSLLNLSLTSALAFTAMLWKEQGITILAICAAINILRIWCQCSSAQKTKMRDKAWSSRRDWISLIFFSVFSACVMSWRLQLQLVAPTFSKSDNPIAAQESLLTRSLTFFYLPLYNFKLLLCPDILSFDWSMDSIPVLESPSDLRVLFVVIFYLCFFFLNFRLLSQILKGINSNIVPKRNQNQSFILPLSFQTLQLFFGLCFLIIPFLPSTNLFFYVGFVVAERVLFMPSIGYCVLITSAYQSLSSRFPKWKTTSTLCFCILIAAFCSRSVLRNADWKSEESLYKSGISVNPAKAFANLANVHYSRGQFNQAEYLYFAALSHRPNMGDTHYNLGVMYQRMGFHEKAILSYQNAIDCRPFLTVAYSNMGDSLERLNLADRAETVYKMALRQTGEGIKDQRNFQSGYSNSCFNLAKIQFERNDFNSSASTLELCMEAYRRFGKLAENRVLNLYGRALGRMGRVEEARQVFNEVLTVAHNDVNSLLAFGSFLVQSSANKEEVETLFTKIFSLYPQNAMAHDVYGYYQLDKTSDFNGAVKHYREAIRLLDAEENSKSKGAARAVINLAHAYRHLGDYEKAEESFRKSVELNPKLVEVHSNLGAVLHLRKKYSEAKEAYIKALEIDPNNKIASANLEKLSRITGKT